MDLDIKNKVAIVTGGTKGIGYAVVKELISEGSKVAFVARSGEEGLNLQKELGENSFFIKADLSDFSVTEEIKKKTLEKFGSIDIIVNNVGRNDGVGLDSTPQKFSESLKLNLVSYFGLVSACLEQIKKNKGSIINISSKVAEIGQGGTSAYAAANGGINALTKEWARELAPFGVRVNTVIPSETHTEQYESWVKEKRSELSEEEINEIIISIGKKIPLSRSNPDNLSEDSPWHRFTRPNDVAKTVAFLSSNKSAGHITGQNITVDGGYRDLRD